MDDRGPQVSRPVRWRRRGVAVAAPGPGGDGWTHAQLAVPVPLADGALRIFFATRDPGRRSHVAFADVELDVAAETVRAVRSGFSLAPGPRGAFDGDGLYPSSLVRTPTETLLYTIGWNAGHPPPLFYASIGLARARALDGFRAAAQPVLSRSAADPFLVTGPSVLLDGGRFRMWYVSGLGWTQTEDGLKSRYHVRYAESEDGARWTATGRVCLDLVGDETNIGRPWVVKDGDRYRCWFASDSGRGYRIGYAESPDGTSWTRRDPGRGLEPAPGDFDSDAQAYPAVIRHADRWWMFYNGNAFGRDGIGLAVADAV